LHKSLINAEVELRWNRDTGIIDCADFERLAEQLYGIILRESRKKITKDDIYTILTNYAYENAYSPMREFLTAEEWDGTVRIGDGSYIFDLFDIEDTPYHRAVAKSFLKNLVSRGLNPGAPVHQSRVLYGKQGTGKSSFGQLLVGDYYLSKKSLNKFNPEKDYQEIRGMLITEFEEFQTAKSDPEEVKGFLTKTNDRYRAAYGRTVEEIKRTTGFVFTTNKEQFLTDYTGNRRYAILEVRDAAKSMDLKYEKFAATILNNRNQCFAEAAMLWEKEGYTESTLPESMEKNPLAEIEYAEEIEAAISQLLPINGVNILDIQERLLTDRHVTLTANKIATVMGKMGYKNKKTNKSRLWFKEGEPELKFK
jgi:predicted P-loop ATPase